jgi:hypothetical protein
MDTDLRDDMLKLVRYKVLFVRREYEHAFPEQEDLVSENLDGGAFTAWKVAEFIQGLEKGDTPVPARWAAKNYPDSKYVRNGKLIGIEEADKKYLRVYFEVLDRYAREKFKFEEQQIRVLEEIRDALSAPANAFDDLSARLNSQKPRLQALRHGFQRGSKPLAAAMATALAKFRDMGEFRAEVLASAQLQSAFERGNQIKFNSLGLEKFPGRWLGVNKAYNADGTEQPADNLTWQMTWEPGATIDDTYVQRVVGSVTTFCSSNSLPPLSERKVDLALNVYSSDIGITAWLSAWIQFRQEMALIAYQFGDVFLWIAQVLDDQLQPVGGDDKSFWVFQEWITAGAATYYMYGIQFEIDFDKKTAQTTGNMFRKSKFERQF